MLKLSVDQEFDNQVKAMKLKLKKENLDLANSMLKKFEKEKEDLRIKLTADAGASLSAEIQEKIQELLNENEELKKKLGK